MNPREAEIELILSQMVNLPQEVYRDINLTWAKKFLYFYKGSIDKCCSIVPMNRFGLFASRSPIATCLTNKNTVINYTLCLSLDWKKQVDAMYSFFNKNKIKEVHVNEDISIIKNLFVQVATRCSVKSFVHMHGCLGQKHGFLPLTADKILVWDIRNKEKLISWGLESDRIIVEGYDHRYRDLNKNLGQHTIQKVRKDFKLDNRDILLIAPHTTYNYGDGFEKEIMDGIYLIQEMILCLNNTQWNIIIKLHPASKDLGYWTTWLEKNSINAIAIKDYNSYELAYSSKVMVVQSSTYAIDGIVLDKKVLVVDTGFTTGVEEYHDDVHIKVVKSIDDILGGINDY